MDHPAVDEAVAARVAESLSAGSLFVASTQRTVERVVAAERAGAVALLSHPPLSSELRQEVRPTLDESGDVAIPPPEASEEADSVVGSSPELVDVFRVVARVAAAPVTVLIRSEEHTSELQSLRHLVCRL